MSPGKELKGYADAEMQVNNYIRIFAKAGVIVHKGLSNAPGTSGCFVRPGRHQQYNLPVR